MTFGSTIRDPTSINPDSVSRDLPIPKVDLAEKDEFCRLYGNAGGNFFKGSNFAIRYDLWSIAIG